MGKTKAIVYDAENRPKQITLAGVVTDFVYGPDGERVKKTVGAPASVTWYMGGDLELVVTGAQSFNAYLHADVLREGSAYRFLHKDHLALNAPSKGTGSSSGGGSFWESFKSLFK